MVMAETPYRAAYAIVPSDTNPLPRYGGAKGNVCQGVYVGKGGDLAVEMADGTQTIFRKVPQGLILPIHAHKILATGTDAEDLVLLYYT